MKKILILSLVFATFVFANIGKVVAFSGKADLTRDGKNIAVNKTTTFLKNDILNTYKNTKLQILFSDETIISVGQNSTLKINDFIFDDKDVKAEFSMTKGVFRTITGKIGKIAPEKFNLKTKTASIGIRGTQIVTSIENNQEKIFCTEGRIVVLNNITKEQVNVLKGQFVEFRQNSTEKFDVKKTKENDIKDINQKITIKQNLANDSITVNKEEPIVTQTATTTQKTTIVTPIVQNTKVEENTTEEETIVLSPSITPTTTNTGTESTSTPVTQTENATSQTTTTEVVATPIVETSVVEDTTAQTTTDTTKTTEVVETPVVETPIVEDNTTIAENTTTEEVTEVATSTVVNENASDVAKEVTSNILDDTTTTDTVETEVVETPIVEDNTTIVEDTTTEEITEVATSTVVNENASDVAKEVTSNIFDDTTTDTTETTDIGPTVLEMIDSTQDSTTSSSTEEILTSITDTTTDTTDTTETTDEVLNNLAEITSPTYLLGNTTTANYSGDFNNYTYDSGSQYLKDINKDKVEIPTDTTISMNIDFGAITNQITDGEVNIIDVGDGTSRTLTFDGSINTTNSSFDLSPTGTTKGSGGNGTFYGNEADLIKGSINMKTDDNVQLSGSYEASKQ